MNFSVSMTVYGKDDPGHFQTALESIVEQTVRPAEIVLVVDGPVPESLSQVIDAMEVAYPHLKVFRLEKNVGHGRARRKALQECSCELVAVMDSDDISVPDRFEKECRCFEEDETLSIVGSSIAEFEGNTENIIGTRNVPLEDHDIKQYLKSRCPFNQMTVMFKKSHVEIAGGYLDWHHEEDYYLWIRMFLAGCKFRNLPETLVYMRMSADSYARRGGWRYFRSEAALQIYMYRNKVIGLFRLLWNIAIRLIVQMLVPNRLRRWLFRNFFRSRKG